MIRFMWLLFLPIIFTAFLIITVSNAFANPFLVSDPSSDGATRWQVEVDGNVLTDMTGNTVNYDLLDIAAGQHTIRARFGSEWVTDNGTAIEWSEWSDPFVLTRPSVPSIPGGLKIVMSP